MEDYKAKAWLDYPNTSTPITAYELNRIDLGVENAFKAIAQASAGSDENVEFAKNEILDKLDRLYYDLNVELGSSVDEVTNSIESHIDSELLKLDGEVYAELTNMGK